VNHPYRLPPKARPIRRDRDLAFVAAVVWAASVVRVGFALARGETFGATATLAFVAILVLPVMALRRR
jgi:hypothetical protein